MAYITYEMRAELSSSGYARIDVVLAMLRTLYNAALESRRLAWLLGRSRVTYTDQTRELTLVRADDPAWVELAVVVGRGALLRLDRAFQSFFRRVASGANPGYPRYRSHARMRTIELSEVTDLRLRYVSGGRRATLRTKGLPTLKMRLRRQLPPREQLKAVRIVRRDRRVDVCLTFEEDRTPRSPTGRIAGVDLGVAQRATTSDGRHFPRKHPDRKQLQRLRRRAGRAHKGSKNRRHKWAAVRRESRRSAVSERHSAHRLSSALMRDYDLLAIEQLQIQNMTRSARGTTRIPGRGVAQKRALNRAILEQG